MRAELEARPLLIAVVGLIVGLVAVTHIPTILIPLCLVGYLRAWSARWWLLAGLAFGLALAPTPGDPVRGRGFVQGEATVLSTPVLYPDRTTALVEVGGMRLSMTTAPMAPIAQGDTLRLEGIVKPLSEAGMRYRALTGVQGRLRPLSMTVEHSGFGLFRIADRLRRSFLGFAGRTLSPKDAAAVDALCFNVDSNLDDETLDALRDTGTIHLISASGLHVMVLAAVVLGLLSLLPIPRGLTIVLLAGVLALYVAATGMNGPTIRAAILMLVLSCDYLVRRDADSLSALALAAIVCLLWRPGDVLSAGFQLSFVTVGAFALYLPRHTVDHAALRWLKASLVATVASAPLVAYHFGMVTLLSIPANALVAFAATPVVVLSLLAYVLGWWAALAQGIMLAVGALVSWIYISTNALAAVPWAVVYVPDFSGYWLVPLYGCAVLYWRPREIQVR